MQRFFVVSMAVCSFFIVTSCAEKPLDMPGVAKPQIAKKLKFHGNMSTSKQAPQKLVVESLKQNSLNGYPAKKIGEVFDAYGKDATKEWRESPGKDGKVYVDYFCWFSGLAPSPQPKPKGVVKQGLNIKFAIQPDGTTYVTLGAKLSQMQDGKVYTEVVPLPEVEKIVDAIYGNREIVF